MEVLPFFCYLGRYEKSLISIWGTVWKVALINSSPRKAYDIIIADSVAWYNTYADMSKTTFSM